MVDTLVRPRISAFQTKRDADVREDGWFVHPKHQLGVVGDGVGPVHNFGEKPCWHGITQGEWVTRTILAEMTKPYTGIGLKSVVRHINHRVGELSRSHGLQKDATGDMLPGAGAIFFDFRGPTYLHLIQASDTIALWEFDSGEYGWTGNPKVEYEKEVYANKERLKGIHGKDWSKVWLEHAPVERQKRREHVNNPHAKPGWNFSLVNGDPNLMNCIKEFILPMHRLKRVLMCTDSAIPFQVSTDGDRVAPETFEWYLKGGGGLNGLRSVVNWSTREGEDGEATLVVLDWTQYL